MARRHSGRGALGHTYEFQVQATNLAGQTSPLVSATTLVPSSVRPAKGRFSSGWSVHRVRGAWQGNAISSHHAGAKFTLRYSGGALTVIGERTKRGGKARIIFDGRRGRSGCGHHGYGRAR